MSVFKILSVIPNSNLAKNTVNRDDCGVPGNPFCGVLAAILMQSQVRIDLIFDAPHQA
jgi:hypothetical protein